MAKEVEKKSFTMADFAKKLNREYSNNNLVIKSDVVPVYGATSIGKNGLYIVNNDGKLETRLLYDGISVKDYDSNTSVLISSNKIVSESNEFIFSRKIPGTDINGGVLAMTVQNGDHHISLQGQVLTLQSWGTDINNKKIASGISLQPTGNIAFKQTNASGEIYSNYLPSKEGTIPVAYVDDRGYLHIDT